MQNLPQAKNGTDDWTGVESDALFMSIGDGAIVTNDRGEITRVNEKALEILGMEQSDMIGQWYTDVVVAIDEKGDRIPNINRPITEVFLTGRTVTARLKYRRPDQSSVTVALSVSPIMLANRPIGAIEVFRDITKEVELERAKDEFIALASHQLRTPATGVKQYLGMLLQGYAGDLTSEQISMAKKAYESNERQIAIINDLLQVARVDAGEVKLDKKQVDLFQLIQDIINEQKGKLEERKQGIEFDGQLKTVTKVDPGYMRMAIENLLDNASKYSPVKSTIRVKLRRWERRITISVSDEGLGVAPRDKERIFQKFYRLTASTTTSVSGTGLGLYWVKQIVDLHSGTISVKPREPNGTRFTISLPHRTVQIKQLNGS